VSGFPPDRKPGGKPFDWAIAQSPILGTTITLERLRKRGYEALLRDQPKG